MGALTVHCPTLDRKNPSPFSLSSSFPSSPLSPPSTNADLLPFARSASRRLASTFEGPCSGQSRRPFSTTSHLGSARSMKRFYESVSIASGGANSFEILLDGKKLKTPSG